MNFLSQFYLNVWTTLFLILFSSSSLAYEVDNFTDRDKIKKDSLVILDQKVNHILTRSVREANKDDPGSCNIAYLRQEILSWIRPDPTGQIEVWLELSKDIDRAEIGLHKSIYQDVSFLESPILNMVGVGRSILLAGQIVGSDKIGHFFVQGLGFYDLVKGGKPLEKVLAEDHGEDGVWGLATSGVYSYGDIAADYQGYRFWSQLTTGEHPYIRCDEKKGWVNERSFSWAEYVNPAWDEAINCSEMRPSMQAKVDQHFKKHGLKCPMKPEVCTQIVALDHAEFFTGPKCQAAAQELKGVHKMAQLTDK